MVGLVAEGLGRMIVATIVIVAIVIGSIVFVVTKLMEPKELIVKKPLVPELRLITDGKKIDTVFVYKLK